MITDYQEICQADKTNTAQIIKRSEPDDFWPYGPVRCDATYKMCTEHQLANTAAWHASCVYNTNALSSHQILLCKDICSEKMSIGNKLRCQDFCSGNRQTYSVFVKDLRSLVIFLELTHVFECVWKLKITFGIHASFTFWGLLQFAQPLWKRTWWSSWSVVTAGPSPGCPVPTALSTACLLDSCCPFPPHRCPGLVEEEVWLLQTPQMAQWLVTSLNSNCTCDQCKSVQEHLSSMQPVPLAIPRCFFGKALRRHRSFLYFMKWLESTSMQEFPLEVAVRGPMMSIDTTCQEQCACSCLFLFATELLWFAAWQVSWVFTSCWAFVLSPCKPFCLDTFDGFLFAGVALLVCFPHHRLFERLRANDLSNSTCVFLPLHL